MIRRDKRRIRHCAPTAGCGVNALCRRGFEMDFAELLLEDYKASLKYLSDHPKLQGIAQQNSFKHT
ncbi:hypothetical protein K6U01_16865 [Escherichia coli]|nr:hypothetical protein [Escherichia coli]UAX51544.1 hypothetical protein K6U01_16865 [Escherichia coli]